MNADKGHFFNRITLTLMIFGVLIAFLIHQIEISSTRLGWQLHQTADDASYVSPAINFWDTGTWKDNSEGPSSFTQRPPLTGIVHLLGFLISGKNNVIGFFIIALILHGFAIAFYEKIMLQFINKGKARLATIIFILSPCFYGFLSYSISEAIYLPFLLMGIYFSVVPQKDQLKKVGISLLLLYLLRPVLLLILLPIFIYLIYEKVSTRKQSPPSKNSIVLSAILGLLTAFTVSWEGRKFYYTSSISPHPIYHSKNISIFRPPHESMTRLFKLWEYQPEVFHELLANSDTSVNKEILLTQYIKRRNIPIPKYKLKALLIASHQRLFGEINPKKDLVFCVQVDKFTDSLCQENRFQYWVVTPYRSLKENITKSHLNLNIFQERFRGNFFVELMRYSTLFLLILGYVSILVILFLKAPKSLKFLCIGAVVYLLFLAEYQRMNEDRYFLPAAFIGYLIFWILTSRLSEHFLKHQKAND